MYLNVFVPSCWDNDGVLVVGGEPHAANPVTVSFFLINEQKLLLAPITSKAATFETNSVDLKKNALTNNGVVSFALMIDQTNVHSDWRFIWGLG